MNQHKYAFMSFSTPEYSLEENLKTCKEFGYDGIELRLAAKHKHGVETALSREERKAVKEKCRAAGVEICCLATSLLFADTPNRAKTLARAQEVLSLAADLSIPRLRVFGGKLPEGTRREQSLEETRKTLSRVLPMAEKAGCTLCFETHDDWSDPRHVRSIVEPLNHPRLKVNWDLLHPVRRGLASIEESFEILAPWIDHVHVHDSVFDIEADTFDFRAMGEGDIDHKTALELLQDMGYKGYVSGEWINFEAPEVHLPRELAVLREYETR